ncbi:MAG: tRNA uridine-5-carboxymethylaminomethyl(34) synthesis GTPase MnmE [Magnetospirillum sp.]|nr:tRNA uridine-5-carboxymethylaminomethyl(34) synthesis GTPase MnmE [Magnetospirillum sp.]
MPTQTIYALASAAGRAGVAVWRLSGSRAGDVLRSLTGRDLPEARKAVRGVLRDQGGEIVDDGLVLWFPAPASFTGEDVVELHLHGGRAVAVALAEALAALGLRPAEPGEFSRRAFLNGKLDLTRAEAIADLVEAETSAQRRQALRQMEGGLARLAEDWRGQVVRAMAHLEAVIDFADEDIPQTLLEQSIAEIAGLRAELDHHLADHHRGERLRDGIHIAIIGAPNAGKSSLLNRLAGRDAAIVSAQAGTTRDIIEVHLDLRGWPVIVADTAGLRDSACEIEAEGVRRATARAASADLKLAVFDGSLYPSMDSGTLDMIDDATLVVLNKRDLVQGMMPAILGGRPVVAVSVKSGDGLDALVEILGEEVERRFAVGNAPVLTRARHRAAVEEAGSALARFDPQAGPEMAAEDLRLAARALLGLCGLRGRRRRRPCRGADRACHPTPGNHRRYVVQSGHRRSGQGSAGARDRRPGRADGTGHRPRRHPVPYPQPQQGTGGAGAARPGRPQALPSGHAGAAGRDRGAGPAGRVRRGSDPRSGPGGGSDPGRWLGPFLRCGDPHHRHLSARTDSSGRDHLAGGAGRRRAVGGSGPGPGAGGSAAGASQDRYAGTAGRPDH